MVTLNGFISPSQELTLWPTVAIVSRYADSTGRRRLAARFLPSVGSGYTEDDTKRAAG